MTSHNGFIEKFDIVVASYLNDQHGNLLLFKELILAIAIKFTLLRRKYW